MYFAISNFSSDFSDNRFLNLFYSGISEILGSIAMHISLNRIGRVRTAFLFLMAASGSTIVLPFLSKGKYFAALCQLWCYWPKYDIEYQVFVTSVAVVGKASVAAMFYGWYLITSEVLPTLHRSTGVSFCSSFGRIATVIAPYLMYASKIKAYDTGTYNLA